MKTQHDLYIEYGRVVEMCRYTSVNPWECVRYDDGSGFDYHPNFQGVCEQYHFAIAIVDNALVFVADLIRSKNDANSTEIEEARRAHEQEGTTLLFMFASWAVSFISIVLLILK